MSESTTNFIPLPQPRLDGPMSVEKALLERRSIRRYAARELSLEQIGQLLWSAQGITGGTPSKRAAPSAGARHPLEVYLCRHDGIWHYNPERHNLRQYLDHDVRAALADASWKQSFIAQAPCVFAMSALFTRSTERYKERGRTRYVPMDAGHAGENMLLQAVALGLGAVVVAAFDDAEVREVLHLPLTEETLYLIPVGYPA